MLHVAVGVPILCTPCSPEIDGDASRRCCQRTDASVRATRAVGESLNALALISYRPDQSKNVDGVRVACMRTCSEPVEVLRVLMRVACVVVCACVRVHGLRVVESRLFCVLGLS